MRRIAEGVKNSAYEIIEKKNATYYGIAMTVRRLCEAIVRDEKSVLPVSNLMQGDYGLDDVVLSMPAIIGRGGIEQKVPISLSAEEQRKLEESAAALRAVIDELDLPDTNA